MPLNGHVVPIRAIAGNLVERGYDVTMVTGSSFRAKFEELGISFEPVTGYGDFIDEDFDTRFAERANYEGPAKMIYDMEHIFAKSMTHSRPDAVLCSAHLSAIVPTACTGGTTPAITRVSDSRLMTFGCTLRYVTLEEWTTMLMMSERYIAIKETDQGKMRIKRQFVLRNHLSLNIVVSYFINVVASACALFTRDIISISTLYSQCQEYPERIKM
jgi:hypothetical protein